MSKRRNRFLRPKPSTPTVAEYLANTAIRARLCISRGDYSGALSIMLTDLDMYPDDESLSQLRKATSRLGEQALASGDTATIARIATTFLKEATGRER